LPPSDRHNEGKGRSRDGRRKNPPTEFLWAFGKRIPKTILSRIQIEEDLPPHADLPDMFNDDYWRWRRYNMPRLVEFLDIEAPSVLLS